MAVSKSSEISGSKVSASTIVEVSMPASIHIELVQGNELRNYEIFLWLASLALSTAVGFWTAFITMGSNSEPLRWSGIAFTGLAVMAAGIVYYFRSKLYNGRVKRSATLDQFNIVK